jgi:hypothetical protein
LRSRLITQKRLQTQIEGLASSKTLASKLGEREGYGGPCDVTSLSL